MEKNYIGLFAFIIFFQAKTQEIIQKKDSINGTVYTITMDSRIDRLLTEAENTSGNEKANELNNSEHNILFKPNKSRSTTAPVSNHIISPKKLSIAEICKESPKLKGYKIQITVTNNRIDADKLRYEVRRYFPDLRTELDSSLRPNYKILAGSYFNKQSGGEDLKKVRKIFKDAILITYRVFCLESE